jgi:hypothetical protein
MKQRNVSFKQAVNDAIRAGELAGQPRTFSTEPATLGIPVVNLDHALRVAADLEDEELLRKMRVGK